jgi:hypothetical protein
MSCGFLSFFRNNNHTYIHILGISWDRVDGCANALIVLIALDSNRFLHCINLLVQQQEEYLRPPLLAAFEKLTSTGIYSFIYLFLYSIDRIIYSFLILMPF